VKEKCYRRSGDVRVAELLEACTEPKLQAKTVTSISLCPSISTHHYTHLPTQPGECPVVLEVTTDEGASSDALPMTAVVPEARSRTQSYSAGPVCYWSMYSVPSQNYALKTSELYT